MKPSFCSKNRLSLRFHTSQKLKPKHFIHALIKDADYTATPNSMQRTELRVVYLLTVTRSDFHANDFQIIPIHEDLISINSFRL